MKKVDKILAGLGAGFSLLGCVVLLILHILQPISLLLMLFLTFLYYLLKGDSVLNLFLDDRGSPPSFLNNFPNIHIYTTFAIAIFCLISIHASQNVLSRPLWLLIIFLIPAILVLLQIVYKVYKFPGGEFAIFIQILMLVAAVTISSIITFPYNGGDTWAHLYNASLVGNLQTFSGIQGSYVNYPLFPVLIDIASMITGISIDQAARWIVVFSAAASLILMYSFARDSYGSARRGLFIILLLAGSKWFLYWNTLVVSMTIAIFLFTAFYVLLNRRLFQPDISKAVLLFLVAGLSPFFHPVGSVAIIILTGVYWLVDSIVFGKDKKFGGSDLLALVGFVIVVTISQWIFYGQTFTTAIRSLASAIFQDTPDSVRLGASFSDPLTYLANNINFFVLVSLGLIEILRQIRIKQDRPGLYSGICGIIFIGFAYSTQLINLQAVLPYRWLYFGTLLLVVPASNILMALFRSKTGWRRFILIGCFGIYFFLGYINTDVNRDHPLYSVQSTERYEVTSSEFAGLKFIENNGQNIPIPLRVDLRLWDYLKLHMDNPQLGSWQKIDLASKNTIFSLRTIYNDHRIMFVGDSVDKINIDTPFINYFYDAGDLKWLEWVPSLH